MNVPGCVLPSTLWHAIHTMRCVNTRTHHGYTNNIHTRTATGINLGMLKRIRKMKNLDRPNFRSKEVLKTMPHSFEFVCHERMQLNDGKKVIRFSHRELDSCTRRLL